MADVKLSALLSGSPVTTALTGDEPMETVVSGASKGAELRQLSYMPVHENTASSDLVLIDQGAVVEMNVGSANILTVPLNSSVAFPIGASLLVRQTGTGATTIAAAGGVSLNQKSSATLVLSERWAQIVLHKTGTDTWHTTGEYLAV